MTHDIANKQLHTTLWKVHTKGKDHGWANNEVFYSVT